MNFAAIEADVAAGVARLKHAVMALLGMAEEAQADVATLEAESPLVRDAIVAGEAAATARGIPVAAIVAGVDTVLAMAKQVAAAQAEVTAPAVPATPAPAKA